MLNQAGSVIPADPQPSNSDLPTGQEYYCLSEAEERQADERIAAWEQYNAPWTLSAYLETLRQSPQIPLASNCSSTSSSVIPNGPNGHNGQSPDRPIDAGTNEMSSFGANQRNVPKSDRLIDAGTSQIPHMNVTKRKIPRSDRLTDAETSQMSSLGAKQRRVPRSIPPGPAKRRPAKSHPVHIDTGATYKLPTGEVINEQHKARRLHFAGYPPITQPLPEAIEDEDIIKHWPNHLWGPLLLGIAEKWKPIEIAHMTSVDLGSNAISKRIKAAKIQTGGGIPQTRGQKRKRFAGEKIPLDVHEAFSQPETELEDSQAFRTNNARVMGMEDVRQSDRLRKRRKSAV